MGRLPKGPIVIYRKGTEAEKIAVDMLLKFLRQPSKISQEEIVSRLKFVTGPKSKDILTEIEEQTKAFTPAGGAIGQDATKGHQ